MLPEPAFAHRFVCKRASCFLLPASFCDLVDVWWLRARPVSGKAALGEVRLAHLLNPMWPVRLLLYLFACRTLGRHTVLLNEYFAAAFAVFYVPTRRNLTWRTVSARPLRR